MYAIRSYYGVALVVVGARQRGQRPAQRGRVLPRERAPEAIVDEYRRGGVTAQAKERIDKALDALRRGRNTVITSYSIHYTKLYDDGGDLNAAEIAGLTALYNDAVIEIPAVTTRFNATARAFKEAND